MRCKALEKDALEAKKRHWLSFHDQKTGGIMGMLPLIKGLPVRLSDHVDRNMGLYKNTKCTIHSWSLNVFEALCSQYAHVVSQSSCTCERLRIAVLGALVLRMRACARRWQGVS